MFALTTTAAAQCAGESVDNQADPFRSRNSSTVKKLLDCFRGELPPARAFFGLELEQSPGDVQAHTQRRRNLLSLRHRLLPISHAFTSRSFIGSATGRVKSLARPASFLWFHTMRRTSHIQASEAGQAGERAATYVRVACRSRDEEGFPCRFFPQLGRFDGGWLLGSRS